MKTTAKQRERLRQYYKAIFVPGDPTIGLLDLFDDFSAIEQFIRDLVATPVSESVREGLTWTVPIIYRDAARKLLDEGDTGIAP